MKRFSELFVNSGITRLVYGKSMHSSRNSVMGLLGTLLVGETYELYHVNVVLIFACFHPRIVCSRRLKCEATLAMYEINADGDHVGNTCQLWEPIETQN
jgi:hypothetical protein